MPISKKVKSRRVRKKVKSRRVRKKVKSRRVRKSKNKSGKSYSPVAPKISDEYITTKIKEYRITYYNDSLRLESIIRESVALGIPIVIGGFYSIPVGVKVKLINRTNPYHTNIWAAKILSAPEGSDFYKYPNDTYISSFNVDDF